MLKELRHRLAMAISSKAVSQKIEKVRVESYQTPNIPIYSDMSVYKATREGYKISVWVYRATRTIIQAASAIPWVVIGKDGEPIGGHPLELLLKNPNPEFSGQDIIELLIAHLELVGNALWQPVIVGKQVREIWPVMPDMVRPIPSKERGEWLRGWDVTIDGRHETLPPHQFIHFMQVDPGNPYWGISPLIAAARTVDTDNEAQDTQKISMQNRGLVDGVFTHETPLTKEQFDEARRQIREKFLDKSRRREPWVLGAGAKWNQMSLTPVEMDFIASRLANMRAIASAFGLDPWWLGDKQASTFSNVAEARKALYEDVVIPLLDDVRSTINLKISPIYGDVSVTYDLSGIPALREDFGKKVTQAKDLWNMGVPFEQINSRLEMGFEEFRGWDSGYLPMNLLPTGAPREEESEVEEEETEEAEKSYKSLNLESDEAKTRYWKAIDRRRMGWWGVIAKKIEPLYEEEAKEIAEATKGKETPEDIESASARVIKRLSPKWEKVITAALVTLVDDFGSRIADDLGAQPKGVSPSETKWRFDPFSVASRLWIERHGAEAIKTILATNLADVRGVILKGKEENLLMPQIGQRIKDFYSDRSAYKAMRVARTEVSASAGFGQREAAKQSGIVKTKKWMSSRDDRVRDSHQAMDGEERQLDEAYSNGLMYPGDPGGDPSESIQCRCAEQYMSREPEKFHEEEVYMPEMSAVGDVDAASSEAYSEGISVIPEESRKAIKAIELHSEPGYTFTVGDSNFQAVGLWNREGRVTVFDVNRYRSRGDVLWILGHESGHAGYQRLGGLAINDSEIMPALARHAKAVKAEGGITDYSRAYVKAAQAEKPGTLMSDILWNRALDEDFAEAHKYFVGYGSGPAALDKFPKTKAAFTSLWDKLGGGAHK